MWGCARCFDPDARAAWNAPFTLLARIVDESHFSLTLRACAGCGQASMLVFTELIDWRGGDDSQCWSLVPVTPEERDRAIAAGDAFDIQWLVARAGDRPFLTDVHPRGGTRGLMWKPGGFFVLPHD